MYITEPLAADGYSRALSHPIPFKQRAAGCVPLVTGLDDARAMNFEHAWMWAAMQIFWRI